MAFANLHMHTYFSDGMTSPADIAKRVYAENGLKYFAITDHDTLSGIEPVFRFIRENSKSTLLNQKRFIPGIEMSLEDSRTGIAAHLIGLFPGVDIENYPEALKKIDTVLGEFCRYRCENRVIKDLDFRIRRAFELNLDGISDRFDAAETVIKILREKAETRNRAHLKDTGKDRDIIQHPIPITYQTIIDHWEDLVPPSTREKITLYTMRPDIHKVERLTRIYMSEGMAESEAKKRAETNQASMFSFRNSPIKELGILEGLSLLQKAEAITILAHPAMNQKEIGRDDFDHHIVYPLIKEGLKGLEVYYPYYESIRDEVISRYHKIAIKHNLLISGGTDFHGNGRTGLADVKLSVEAALKIVNHRRTGEPSKE